jgi:GNAT superfamily N-acetyltransferase
MPEESADLVLDVAGPEDVDGIYALFEANGPSGSGAMSALPPKTAIASWVAAPMPVAVARRGGRVVAFLATTEPADQMTIPIIQAMFDAFPGTPDAYVQGPVIVDDAERGQGLARRLYEFVRPLLGGRQGVLFIRAENAPSIRAHEKMGMRTVGRFAFGGHDNVVMVTP